MMIQIPWLRYPLTEQQVIDHFMQTLEDDTEEKPWMTMGDLQFWSAAGFAFSLRHYAHQRGLLWYVASMHPILYYWRGTTARKQLAPDVYVAFVDDHPRQSFNSEAEGGFPPFVLEVVSPSSSERDQVDKRTAYDALGVQEYVLFTPELDSPSRLQGYHRTPEGFEAWPLDEEDRLRSKVLGLHLVVRGRLLQAVTPEGQLLPNPDQAETARQEAEAARQQAEAARQQAEAARQQAEAEVERLREELRRRDQEP